MPVLQKFGYMVLHMTQWFGKIQMEDATYKMSDCTWSITGFNFCSSLSLVTQLPALTKVSCNIVAEDCRDSKWQTEWHLRCIRWIYLNKWFYDLNPLNKWPLSIKLHAVICHLLEAIYTFSPTDLGWNKIGTILQTTCVPLREVEE